MKKLSFPLATWSFFATGGFLVLLKALDRGQPWRIAGAAAGLAVAIVFVLLLLAQVKKQNTEAKAN